MFGAKKLYWTLWDALFREVPSNYSATDLSSRIYNDQATTGRGEDVGCELGLEYTLIVAAELSRNYSTTVDKLHAVVLKVARVRCEISLNRKHPSRNIYAAEGRLC